jgi:hypothetical protein
VALLGLSGAVFTAHYAWLSRRMRLDSLVGGALLLVALMLGVLRRQRIYCYGICYLLCQRGRGGCGEKHRP